MDYFVIGEMSRVLAEDSTPKTHPIVNSIHNVDDIQSMFNAIIYGKVS
jgi:aminopeptidase N